MKKRQNLNSQTNTPLPFREKTDCFLNYLKHQKHYSAKTIEAYNTDISGFMNYIKITEGYPVSELSNIEPAFIKNYLWELKNNGYHHNSIRRKLSALKSFFKYLQKEELIENNPAATLSAGKKVAASPSFLTEDEIEEMLNSVQTDNWEGLRDRTILELFYATGVRLNELIGLRKDNFNETGKWIKVTGKGNKERYIPIGDIAINFLKTYMNETDRQFPDYKNNPLVFITRKGKAIYPVLIQRMVKRFLAGFSRASQKSPHTLRHSFATHMLNAGADILTVKELLGHASLSTTQMYTHLSIEALKDTYKQAHPRSGREE